MKRTLATLALAIAFTAAHAEQIDCAQLGSTARSVMGARQAGVPLSRMMEIAGDSQIFRGMVADAYKKPRWNTQGLRDHETDEFANGWELACHSVNDERRSKKKGGGNV